MGKGYMALWLIVADKISLGQMLNC